MDSKTFLIPVMEAEDAKTIEAEISQISGVRQVLTHVPTHSVTVTWGAPATWDDINRRLLKLNFTPDLPQAF